MRLLAWGTVVVAVAGIVAANATYRAAAPPLPRVPPAPAADFSAAALQPFALAAARPVYRHSVVPGGVLSADEALAAVARDPEVAHHYAGLDLDRLRPVRLAEPLAVHVSYRKDGRVQWTNRRLTLPAGELLVTDGTSSIRARCGNRLVASLDGIRDADTDPAFASHELDSLDSSPALGRPYLRSADPGQSEGLEGPAISALATLPATSAVSDPVLAMFAPARVTGQTVGAVPGGASGSGPMVPAGGPFWSPLFLGSRAAPLIGPDMIDAFPLEQDLVFVDPRIQCRTPSTCS